MARILIIDDDEMTCAMLGSMAEQLGHAAESSGTVLEGERAAGEGDYDLVLLDVNLPDGNGLELLPKIRTLESRPEVIIITAVGDADGAELAVRSGAWDYVQKPLSMGDLKLSLSRALEYRASKAKRSVVLDRRLIVGSSEAVEQALRQLAEGAGTDVSVLISGETGTGKELFARTLHENSPRAGRPFVVVDCASLPPTLTESVLFGHRKGAFTGADREAKGLIAEANGGTLFLDEIGEMPLEAQRIFLRALQERSFRPVGANREVKSDFRVVAATNRDLQAMVDEGLFRSDLLFRLRGFPLKLPPLRERKEDIKELIYHFMLEHSEKSGLAPKAVSGEFLDKLCGYDWPGNVRELSQVLHGAMASARFDDTLLPAHLPTYVRVSAARASVRRESPAGEPAAGPDGPGLPSFKEFRIEYVDRAERDYMIRLIEASGGDPGGARKISGLSKTRLYELLKKHKLSMSNS
jgi:two-component system NtrC family response regulator